MRGFAVFLVFLVHYAAQADPWLDKGSNFYSFVTALHLVGNVGVDLFFVLSGYLIYGSLIIRPQKFFSFIYRRVKRIYPAFIVVFLIYISLSFLFPAENKIPHSFFQGAEYLVANLLLLPGIARIEPIITVAWSLSYEMLYYLLIPLIISVLSLRQRTSLWRVCFFSAVAIGFLAYCAVYGGPFRLITFVAGILLFEILNNTRTRAPGSALGLLVVAATLLIRSSPATSHLDDALKTLAVSSAFFIMCFSCFRYPSEWLARSFSITPLRWFGNMSYSYYLIHGLALKGFFLVFSKIFIIAEKGPVFFFAMMTTSFIVSLTLPILLFLTVERPFSLASRSAQLKATAFCQVT